MTFIDKVIKEMKKGNTHYFYTSWPWRKKRKQILIRDNRECQKCRAKGGFSKATCVHHIEHLKDRPDLALIDINLISLCDSCHNHEHPEKLEGYKEKKGFMNEEKWE